MPVCRAGRSGGALLFIRPEEEAYIHLLRGRGVPLQQIPVHRAQSTAQEESQGKASAAEGRHMEEHDHDENDSDDDDENEERSEEDDDDDDNDESAENNDEEIVGAVSGYEGRGSPHDEEGEVQEGRPGPTDDVVVFSSEQKNTMLKTMQTAAMSDRSILEAGSYVSELTSICMLTLTM